MRVRWARGVWTHAEAEVESKAELNGDRNGLVEEACTLVLSAEEGREGWKEEGLG